MSRKRDLSSDISIDTKIAELSACGFLPVCLYMMAIPQADDWGRLPGNPREFKMLVCPGFDVSVAQVADALSQIGQCGLWDLYSVGEKQCIAFPPDAWFKRQSYINIGKRYDDSGSNLPSGPSYKAFLADTAHLRRQNSKKQQETATNGEERHNPSPPPTPSVRKEFKNQESERASASDSSLRDSKNSEPEQPAGPGHTEPPTLEMVKIRLLGLQWTLDDAQPFLNAHNGVFRYYNRVSFENWAFCLNDWVRAKKQQKTDEAAKQKAQEDRVRGLTRPQVGPIGMMKVVPLKDLVS